MKYFLLLFLASCGSTQTTPDGSAPTDAAVEGGVKACGSAVDGLKIASQNTSNPLDPLGYPPFSAHACQLAYVAKDGTLMLRDLKSGTDVIAADLAEKPRRPSLHGGTLAWEATIGGKDVVRWRNPAGGVDTIPSMAFRAGEPRASADAIAFTGWMTSDVNGDTDVFLFSTTDKSIASLGDGPAQQRFSDIDATRVAWSDFSEAGPLGAFESDLFSDAGYTPADIVVYDRASKTKTTRKAAAKQAFPLLVANGNIAYLDWDRVRPQPKFFAYGFKMGPVSADPTLDVNIGRTDTIETNAPYVRPTVQGSSFEWLENGALWQRPIYLSALATRVDAFSGNAYGVVAIDGLTILAVGNLGDLSLLGLAR